MECKNCNEFIYSGAELWEVKGTVLSTLSEHVEWGSTHREHVIDAGVFCSQKCAGQYLTHAHDEKERQREQERRREERRANEADDIPF